MIRWIKRRYQIYKVRRRLRKMKPEEAAELILKASIDMMVWDEASKIFVETMKEINNETKTD